LLLTETGTFSNTDIKLEIQNQIHVQYFLEVIYVKKHTLADLAALDARALRTPVFKSSVTSKSGDPLPIAASLTLSE
jgi:hypothetical protein